MKPDLSRVGRGELIAGVCGILLLVFTIALTWFALKPPLGWTAATLGVPTSYTGWQSITHLRWLVVITAAAAIALPFVTAIRRAPAVPVALAVVVIALALLTFVLLLYRVLITVPGPGELDQQVGAYLGLLAPLGIFYGGYAALHREGVAPRDAPSDIELVKLGAGTGASGEPVAH
jgi:hypothetical protein